MSSMTLPIHQIVRGASAADVAAVQAELANKQPLDSDLTAIAALPTTTLGRSLLTMADGASLANAIGVAADFQTRAEAIAATVPPPMIRIRVLHAGRNLEYVEDADGTALTTNGGTRKWSPAGDPFIEHWGGGVDLIGGTAADVNAAGVVNVAAATAALNSLKRTLYLGSGLYNFFGTVTIDAPTDATIARVPFSIIGQGQDATLIQQRELTAHTFHVEHTALMSNKISAKGDHSSALGNLTAGQTVFSVAGGFDAANFAIWKNGNKLALTTDYTLASPNFTLTSPVVGTDVLAARGSLTTVVAAGTHSKFHPHVSGFRVRYQVDANNTEVPGRVPGGCAAFILHSCEGGLFSDITVEGPDYGWYGSSVNLVSFHKCMFSAARRSPVSSGGADAKAAWKFTGHPIVVDRQSNSCSLVDCGTGSTAGLFVKDMIVVTTMEFLAVEGGHWNSWRDSFLKLDLDDGTANTFLSNAIVDMRVCGAYLDHANDPLDVKNDVFDIGASKVLRGPNGGRIHRVRVDNCYIRAEEMSGRRVFHFAQGATDYNNLRDVYNISFDACHFGGWGTMGNPTLDFRMNAAYDERALIRDVKVSNCEFTDNEPNQFHNPATPLPELGVGATLGSTGYTGNSSAISLAGTNGSVTDCIFVGKWVTGVAAPIAVNDDTDRAVIHSCVFDTPEYPNNQVVVGASASNWRSFGHVKGTSGGGVNIGLDELVSYTQADPHVVFQYDKGRTDIALNFTLPATDINIAEGAIFRSANIDLGAWPSAFLLTPRACAPSVQTTHAAGVWAAIQTSATATNAPIIRLYSAVSGTGITGVIRLTGLGRA